MKVYLETPRLILREFTEDDAGDLFALDHDPEVMRYIGPYALADVEAYRERILSVHRPCYDRNDGCGMFAAVEKAGGAFLGWFILRPALHYRFARDAGFRAGELEVGYRLRRAAWGKGYATEGTRALVRKAFTPLDAPAVVAAALKANIASVRVLEKAGLRRRGQFFVPHFEPPVLTFALSRDDCDPQKGERR